MRSFNPPDGNSRLMVRFILRIRCRGEQTAPKQPTKLEKRKTRPKFFQENVCGYTFLKSRCHLLVRRHERLAMCAFLPVQQQQRMCPVCLQPRVDCFADQIFDDSVPHTDIHTCRQAKLNQVLANASMRHAFGSATTDHALVCCTCILLRVCGGFSVGFLTQGAVESEATA